jgi:hypothetical protein
MYRQCRTIIIEMENISDRSGVLGFQKSGEEIASFKTAEDGKPIEFPLIAMPFQG